LRSLNFKCVKMSAAKARKRVAEDEDQVVSEVGTLQSRAIVEDDDESFFQDIDNLQSHGIVNDAFFVN